LFLRCQGEADKEVFFDGEDFDCMLTSIEEMCENNQHPIPGDDTLNLYCWFLLCEAGWRLTPFVSPEVPEVYCARVWSKIKSRMEAIRDGPDAALRCPASEYLGRMDAMELESGYDSDDVISVDHCKMLREMLGFGHYFGTFPLANGVTSLHMQMLSDIGEVTFPVVVGWVSVPADGSVGSCTEVVYNRHLPGTQQHWGFIVGTNGHMSWWSCDRGRSEVSLGRWSVVRPVSSPPCRVVAMTCSQVFFGTGQAATSDSCWEDMSSNVAQDHHWERIKLNSVVRVEAEISRLMLVPFPGREETLKMVVVDWCSLHSSGQHWLAQPHLHLSCWPFPPLPLAPMDNVETQSVCSDVSVVLLLW
jgi:hypothetical protein